MNTMAKMVVVGLITLGLLTGVAYAELSVSVTISGPLDELLPLLQHIKDMGIGHGGGENGIKLEMNSVAAPVNGPVPAPVPNTEPSPSVPAPNGTPSSPAPAPAAPQPPPKPVLGFSDTLATPAIAKAGTTVLVSVRLSDPDHQVDTVAATVVGTPGVVDLYDNGTHGDVTAADGIWSAAVTLDAQVKPGDYLITITAYNRNGLAVMVPGPDKQEIPLSGQAKMTVAP